MSVTDDLGDRMKQKYESVPKTKLVSRVPVIVRFDGKCFHSFARGFKRPFDDILIKTMQETTKRLCENIQGAVIGYTQSDEISILIQDYKKLTTAAWFDYEVEKMCSIGASMATLYFNQAFRDNVNIWSSGKVMDDYMKTLFMARDKGALFDARVFNIPEDDVTNYFLWRQNDASRNSVSMVGRVYFSDNELYKQGTSDIQEMLFSKFGVNWNDLETYKKRGTCIIKEKQLSTININGEDKEVERNVWTIDKNIPKFTGDGREYIENRLKEIRQ